MRILNIRGEVVYVTPAFLALNIPPTSVTQPLHGNTWQGTVTAKNGQTVRLYSTALAENGTVYGVVQVGRITCSIREHFTERGYRITPHCAICFDLGNAG